MSTGATIATVYEPEANARLVSAAPELLAAASLALSALGDLANEAGDVAFFNDGGDGRESCKMLRDAINKALGR